MDAGGRGKGETPTWATATAKKGRGTPNTAPTMKFSFDTHCKICTEELETKRNILCDQCGKWLHRECTDVKLQEFEMLAGSGKNIQFFYDECSSSRRELKGLEKRIEKLLTLTTDLRDRLERAGRGTTQLFMLK